jgi:pimeloyl-ACP methyl ester carboxylesterase
MFAVAFWLAGLLAYLLSFMTTCSIAKSCIDAASSTRFEVISAVVAGSIGMWTAVTLVRSVHHPSPVRTFVLVSTGLTLLFAAGTIFDWVNGIGRRSSVADEINGAVRFVLLSVIGCAIGWLLSERDESDREVDARANQ